MSVLLSFLCNFFKILLTMCWRIPLALHQSNPPTKTRDKELPSKYLNVYDFGKKYTCQPITTLLERKAEGFFGLTCKRPITYITLWSHNWLIKVTSVGVFDSCFQKSKKNGTKISGKAKSGLRHQLYGDKAMPEKPTIELGGGVLCTPPSWRPSYFSRIGVRALQVNWGKTQSKPARSHLTLVCQGYTDVGVYPC